MALTIGETISQLHHALADYIEATYHITHPQLIEQRRELLEKLGIIYQQPYLESTPRYETGSQFCELGLENSVLEMFSVVSSDSGGQGVKIHDPPYKHQADSVKYTLCDNRSLVVMTGTGSGKTECFLLPILGKLAREANRNPKAFEGEAAVRALVLYPMNALVNDQLGRLRQLFGDHRITRKFIEWARRPARFARYTSRTLYPGVRTEKKDQDRLAAIRRFYIRHLELASDPSSSQQSAAAALVEALGKRGKWPSKPNLLQWYGASGARWRDSKTGRFKRAIMLPEDPELLTRHEVHENPPDILVTNYSMLEYMLMRPLERPVFDRTRDWLRNNPEETLLLVIDEAHLYRGAAGAEVALLIRRLRTRLGIPPERLQVICTSASFQDPAYASEFGAQLTGKSPKEFATIEGTLRLRKPAAEGSLNDATALATLDLDIFYKAETEGERLDKIKEFLKYRGIDKPAELQRALYDALHSFEPMGELINVTMREALPLELLGERIFSSVDSATAARAVTTLMALGSLARRDNTEPGLLPCRVHAFYRGLAGLWICMDPDCADLAIHQRGQGPGGRLYSQPRDACECGARVLELYTCRNCGTAYARAYTDSIDEPQFLWAEPGEVFRTLSGPVDELEPLDLLLEKPNLDETEPAEYDLITGRINPKTLGTRNRQVFIQKNRSRGVQKDKVEGASSPGEFRPCAVCGEQGGYGRTSVQDHQTKGDQPFQALVTKQIQVQPPNPVAATRFAPLRGRKVLVFSDSRQTAARLAPNLQAYSTRDVMRAVLICGFDYLQRSEFLSQLTLEDMYFAVLIAADKLGVRLRPELRSEESFAEETIVREAMSQGAFDDPKKLLSLYRRITQTQPPQSLIRDMTFALNDRYYGLESLALASIVECDDRTEELVTLPAIPGLAASKEEKLALTRAWLRCWRASGFWLSRMPGALWQAPRSQGGVQSHSGSFSDLKGLLGNSKTETLFKREWLPKLLQWFAEKMGENKYRLLGRELSLNIAGDWAYCASCRTTQRPYPGRTTCITCGKNSAKSIDVDTDPAFLARKRYYRAGTLEALRRPDSPPMAIIASEHSAQLNAAQAGEVFSKAEEHELLFQDVNLGTNGNESDRSAIDVLSCTTTMEVGIDIGTLSGVALRNMPPARANYQQRAGRAGRRGNAVATVIAFGSADSHDEHNFQNPDQMIRGNVADPKLTMDNVEITQRHVTAYILQRYHQERLPNIEPEEQPHLFAVLGTVAEFKKRGAVLNRYDLADWLKESDGNLQKELVSWLPEELSQDDREYLLRNTVKATLDLVDRAIDFSENLSTDVGKKDNGLKDLSDTTSLEVAEDSGEEKPRRDPTAVNLLDRLLYKGVLPRYAFPTDVATFYVFDVNNSSQYRPEFEFAPSQGLAVALSEYAPGKEVWIGSKLWTSGAIYSPISGERFAAWQNRRLYYECNFCHYAKTVPLDEGVRDEKKDCEACGESAEFGPARYWLRPPGFAHPAFKDAGTSPEDQPAKSYATRAKLTAPTPIDEALWTTVNSRIRLHHTRQHLLVTNRGPRQEGYTYCTKCGLVEPTAMPDGTVGAAHKKPFPDQRDPNCSGGGATKGLVLGTDFITDVLLVSLSVQAPLSLAPGYLGTDVALRTLSESLSKAACELLDLEQKELQAEYRPAMTNLGRQGLEAEIYLYDTLPGGAGFARRVGKIGSELFEKALRILETCPEGCDRSCYRCLRSYKNKFEHELLDRHLGASLLRFLLTGEAPTLDERRVYKSTSLLFEDLKRQGMNNVTIERDKEILVSGIGSRVAPILVTRSDGAKFILGLHGPLTIDEPLNDGLRDIKEYSASVPVILKDELVVRRSLPKVTSDLLTQLLLAGE